jgi:hypothetical protein
VRPDFIYCTDIACSYRRNEDLARSVDVLDIRGLLRVLLTDRAAHSKRKSQNERRSRDSDDALADSWCFSQPSNFDDENYA